MSLIYPNAFAPQIIFSKISISWRLGLYLLWTSSNWHQYGGTQFHCSEDQDLASLDSSRAPEKTWWQSLPSWDRGPVDISAMFHLHLTNFERWESSGITGFGWPKLDHSTMQVVLTHGDSHPEVFWSRTASSSLLLKDLWVVSPFLRVHLRLRRSVSLIPTVFFDSSKMSSITLNLKQNHSACRWRENGYFRQVICYIQG